MHPFLKSFFIATPSPRKPFLPSWLSELALLSFLLCREALFHSFMWAKSSQILSIKSPPTMLFRNRCSLKADIVGEAAGTKLAILDLPELAIERILEKLSPAELCRMAGVCSYFRELCTNDRLWKRHVEEKWGRVMGEAARRKWELQVASRGNFNVRGETGGVRPMGWLGFLDRVWPLSWIGNKIGNGRKNWFSLPVNSLISFYLAIESGRFSFPAQVFNRENGNAGFLMSGYDAEISYNPRSNKFYARYPPHGKRVPAIEEVPWERIRAPICTTPAHDLHISGCLNDLNPGDHIEIQWRKNKEFPYGWWYGVVGHLGYCDGDEQHCCCHASDIIVLEFNHYSAGSRWRRKVINRKDHREDGNEDDGFYGGIIKVQNKEDISMWLQFWPAEVQS